MGLLPTESRKAENRRNQQKWLWSSKEKWDSRRLLYEDDKEAGTAVEGGMEGNFARERMWDVTRLQICKGNDQ